MVTPKFPRQPEIRARQESDNLKGNRLAGSLRFLSSAVPLRFTPFRGSRYRGPYKDIRVLHRSRPTPCRRRWAAAVLSLLGIAALTGARPARSAVTLPHFSVTDLGLPDTAESSYATAVNANGQVAGYWREARTRRPHAFIWDATNGIQTLGELSGDNASFATGINDSGQVSGASLDAAGDSHAVMWDGVGTVQNVGTLGGNRSWATGINNANTGHPVQVVGISLSTAPINSTLRPFLWDAENGIRDIGRIDPTTAGLPVSAWSVNDGSLVTGSMPALGAASIVNHAYLSLERVAIRDLDSVSSVSAGYRVNAAGNVAGYTVNGAHQNTLCLWDSAGKHPLLTTVVEDAVDLPNTLRAMGMNSAGDVVFTAPKLTTVGTPHRATLYTGGSVLDLNTLSTLPDNTYLVSALDINDSGIIVGDLLAADGKHHAYLLTPAPVPPPVADLAVTQATSAATMRVGQSVTYTLTVKNNGPDPATNVALTDTLPSNGSYVSSTPAATVSSGKFIVNLGTLASGATATVTVLVHADAEGTMTNTASVSATEVDNTADDDTVSTGVTVNPALPPTNADLTVTLAANPSPAQTGSPITFTATVTNHGPDAAANVVLAPSAGGTPLNLITIDVVNANDTVTRTFTGTPAAAGTFIGAVSVTSDATDANTADNSASLNVSVQNPPPVRKPDLSGVLTGLIVTHKGAAYTLSGTLTVTNVGLIASPASSARLYLSQDRTLDANDTALSAGNKPATVKIPALKSGKGKALKISYRIPAGTDPSTFSGKFLIASIDPDNLISELSKANNTPAGSIH